MGPFVGGRGAGKCEPHHFLTVWLQTSPNQKKIEILAQKSYGMTFHTALTHSFPAKSATLAGRCRPGSVQSLRPGVQMSTQDGS